MLTLSSQHLNLLRFEINLSNRIYLQGFSSYIKVNTEFPHYEDKRLNAAEGNTMGLCCENHSKYINVFCGQNAGSLASKQALHTNTVTTIL
jgi:hypothetical protein